MLKITILTLKVNVLVEEDHVPTETYGKER